MILRFIPRMHRTSGAGGEGGASPEQKALLEKVKESVKTEIETRGYQDAKAVQEIMDKVLEGVNLEALRSFDAEKLNASIKNIAGELEKVKQIRTIGDNVVDGEMIRTALNGLMTGKEGEPSGMELMMRSKGGQGPKEIVLNLRAAATMSTTNTIDENNYPQEMIESMSMGEFVKKRRGTQYIDQIADKTVVAEVDQYKTWLEEGDIQGAFAIVEEGAVKPLMSGALVRNFAKAKKVAAKHVITEEFQKWRKKAYDTIRQLINDKALRDYNAILTVDLQAQAASYVGTSLDGTIAVPTDYHAIGAVAAQIETLNFVPDLIILHPQDKWRLALQQDSEGRFYMMIPMMGADGIVTMMGFRVITSTYQTIGSFTLGESGLFKIEEEAFQVRIGYGIDVTTAVVNGTTVVTNVASDFDTNKLRVIVETFFLDYIATNNIGSFVTASFTTVKAALEAA